MVLVRIWCTDVVNSSLYKNCMDSKVEWTVISGRNVIPNINNNIGYDLYRNKIYQDFFLKMGGLKLNGNDK